MAIVGVYYYFNIIREAFTDRDHLNNLIITRLNTILIAGCAIAVVLAGIFLWDPLI
jgi:NADH:ubiquinone oxidoreductase subunit 2 (subunit N)